MKRKYKNVITILLILIVSAGLLFPLQNIKSNTSSKDIQMLNTQTMPDKSDDNTQTTPKKPEDNNMQNNENDMPMMQTATKTSNITFYHIILISLIIILGLLVIYLIMSKFNKKTFKETFKNKDKIIIYILGEIVFTSVMYLCLILIPISYTTSQSNNTHGSSKTISEDELNTTISKSYKINSDTQKDAKEGAYSALFDTENIQDVKINIDEDNWNYLLQNAIDKPDVLTKSVSIGDYKVSYAGLKTKGNLTIKEVWNSNSDRFSFTINFGKYINKNNGYSEKQNLLGLKKVTLNNIYGDPTLMKEYLSYELMKESGVDTPLYSLVNLYINEDFYGVYMMVESIDSSLTERTINEKSNFLVKPESQGGDLIYDTSLDKYYQNGTFDFSSILYDDSGNIIYPSDKSNPLYSYNGLWENDEDTFKDISSMLPTVFKWLKTLNELSNNEDTSNYEDVLESIIDVDKLIRYFAVNTYLVNLDSYQSEKMQNYALYINESGHATIYPWDYNYSFGGYGIKDATSMVNYSIYNPVLNTSLTDRPLLNVILQNDKYKALYEKYLNDCTIIASKGGTTSSGNEYKENNFSSILDKYYDKLKSIYKEDPTAFYEVSDYEKATSELKQLIEDRSKAVTRQLNGDQTKVETTVDFSLLGGQSR